MSDSWALIGITRIAELGTALRETRKTNFGTGSWQSMASRLFSLQYLQHLARLRRESPPARRRVVDMQQLYI